MEIFYIIRIYETNTKFCGIRFSNRLLCVFFAIAGIILAITSFLQHVYSWVQFHHVFYCRSFLPPNATFEARFLAYDIVIFDYGLMHRILGTTECVANYLDGGYMRAGWCLQHFSALSFLLIALAKPSLSIALIWPALFMQSSYVLGMAILTMATAPKLLEALSDSQDQQLNFAFVIFIGGLSINWLFTFVLWHYYWGIEELKMLDKRRKNENNNKPEIALNVLENIN